MPYRQKSTWKTIWRLIAVSALAVLVLSIGVSWYVRIADPGVDPMLKGLSEDQLIFRIGEPASRNYIELADIHDKNIRSQYFAAYSGKPTDIPGLLLKLTWHITSSQYPTAIRLDVWLCNFDDKWIEFHNFRKKQWAGF